MSSPGDTFRSIGDVVAASPLLKRFLQPQQTEAPAMSVDRDELKQLLGLFEMLVRKVDRGQRELCEMRQEFAEMVAAREIELREQAEINAVLAAQLGGVLVKADPPARSADLKLVVNNDAPESK
jgi:hypothetical protein